MVDVRIVVAAIVLAAAGSAARAQETVYRSGDAVTLPKVIKDAKPQYTSAALRAGITGEVRVELTVRTDGSVDDVAVTRSLDKTYGLDDEAVKAAKQWHFEPGTKDGKAVPVRVWIDMAFTIGGRGRRR